MIIEIPTERFKKIIKTMINNVSDSVIVLNLEREKCEYVDKEDFIVKIKMKKSFKICICDWTKVVSVIL